MSAPLFFAPRRTKKFLCAFFANCQHLFQGFFTFTLYHKNCQRDQGSPPFPSQTAAGTPAAYRRAGCHRPASRNQIILLAPRRRDARGEARQTNYSPPLAVQIDFFVARETVTKELQILTIS